MYNVQFIPILKLHSFLQNDIVHLIWRNCLKNVVIKIVAHQTGATKIEIRNIKFVITKKFMTMVLHGRNDIHNLSFLISEPWTNNFDYVWTLHWYR